MNRTIAIIALLLLLATASMAQTHANIKGKVTDSLSKEMLEFATVAVLDVKDSSLVSYTLTLKNGEFALHNLPSQKSLKLVVSFVSYQNYRKIFELDKAETLDMSTISLSRKGILNQVNITAEVSPVVIRKDTIEFNAEAFKTPPNAVVEELLKRLPGIQVDMDGTITVNGKKVNKLLIDGKQFFANDPKIASRNLDANLIDKVQVYDDRENDPDHLIPESKVQKIINLKFKNAIKKSTFGKWRAGGGTEDRFDGGLLYNTFRDTLQVSLIGIGNNLNHTGFSNQELISQGGFNRSGSDALYNGGLATGGRGYGGIETVGSGGVNINTDYGKKLKINFLYFYGYTSDVYNSTSFSQQFLTDTLNSNNASTSHSTTSRHSFSSLVEWKPDTIFNLRYNPKLSFSNYGSSNSSTSDSYTNLLPQLNSSINGGSSTKSDMQFQQTFSYYRKLHKQGSSLNITHDLNINPSNGLNYSTNDFTSYTTQLPSSNLTRLNDNTNNTGDGRIIITYRYPLTKKVTANVSLSGNYNQNTGRQITYNQNLATGEYDGYIDSLSHNLQHRQYAETIRPELTYDFTKKISLSVNLGSQWVQTDNNFNKNIPNIDQNAFYLLPELRFNTDKFSIDYSENVDQPGINDLLPLTTFYSQLYSTAGNPDLKPTREHNLYLSFYNYKSDKMLNTNFYASITTYDNSIFYQENISSQGANFTRPVNKDGRYFAYMGGSIGKDFKKVNNWQIRLNSRISANLNHYFFQINNVQGFQNRSSFSFNQQVTVNWNNKFEITPAYNISPSITTYQNVDYSTVKYVTQSLTVPITIRWPKRTSFESSYTYNYNPLVAAGFRRSSNLLNIAIARQMQYRDRGELRLSVYDLFDQNISEYRYASGNSVVDRESQILKRYFMLSYSYRFNTTITAKKK